MNQKSLVLIIFYLILHTSLWADVGVGTARPTELLPPLLDAENSVKEGKKSKRIRPTYPKEYNLTKKDGILHQPPIP